VNRTLENVRHGKKMCQPRKGNLAEELMKNTDSWEAKIERMFLSILSRTPMTAERERFVRYLNVKLDSKDPKLASQRLEEAMWVLVSCSEFRFNR